MHILCSYIRCMKTLSKTLNSGRLSTLLWVPCHYITVFPGGHSSLHRGRLPLGDRSARGPWGWPAVGYSVLWTVYTNVGRPPDTLHGGRSAMLHLPTVHSDSCNQATLRHCRSAGCCWTLRLAAYSICTVMHMS